MEPESNQVSKTSGTRFMSPPHFSHLNVISSTICLCKSSTFCPLNSSNSFIEPKILVFTHLCFAPLLPSISLVHLQIGITEAQNLCREIDQSRAPSSHCPNRPSFMCAGIQLIFLTNLIASGFTASTFTNHDEVA